MFQVDAVNQPDQTDTINGTQCLIHSTNGSGQDSIVADPPPFKFVAGSNNPITSVRGNPIATSDSLVTVPLFNSTTGVPASVQPIGFLQLFIRSVDPTGTIQGTIVNVVGCSTNNPGGNAFISGGGISPIPVRLVQPGGGN